MAMLDILTIIHSFADIQTAARIRQTCRRLAVLIPLPVLYPKPTRDTEYEYRVGNKLHRLDGPAMKSIYGSEYWYSRGVAHREYHPQNLRKYKTYMVDGLVHREACPARVYRHSCVWYMRGKLHRKTGPADTWLGEVWFTFGRLHRLDNPAYDNVYMIRGIPHSISDPIDDIWKVDGVVIRR